MNIIKISVLATLIVVFISSCGHEYHEADLNYNLYQVIGEPSALTDQQKTIAYTLCNAFKSKKSDFATLPFNTHFKFNFSKKDCDSTSETFLNIDTILEISNNSYTFKQQGYVADFIESEPVDSDQDFVSICGNSNLPNGAILNTVTLNDESKKTYYFSEINGAVKAYISTAKLDLISNKFIITNTKEITVLIGTNSGTVSTLVTTDSCPGNKQVEISTRTRIP